MRGKNMAKNHNHYYNYMRGAFQAGAPSYSIAIHPECPQSPFDMCLTQEALMQILETIGSRPPETGAKIFSPADYFGIETVEFDLNGSFRAGGAVYSPDTRWGMQRIQYHMEQPEIRLWSGDIHSHPGGFGYPSLKSGPGLGDLGYVEEVFKQNEMMEYFLLPILTGAGTGHVIIHPWICRRGNPVELLISRLHVHHDDLRFPKRIFNPDWEQRINRAIVTEPMNYDITEVPRGETETTTQDMQENQTLSSDKTAPMAPMPVQTASRHTDIQADMDQDRVATLPTSPVQEENPCQKTFIRKCLNPDELKKAIEKNPEVKEYTLSYNIILKYDDMICEVNHTDKTGAETPKIFVHVGETRRVFEHHIWDKFAALALEDRLLACCNYCINHMKEERGKGKQ